MMVTMPGRRRTLVVLISVACAVALAVGIWWYANRGPNAEVVDDAASSAGWKTIEFEGVRVDIPASWEALDLSDCEFEFERWGPPEVSPCDPDAEGVAFYGSSTFDAEHGPGVIRDSGQSPKAPDWEGYAYAGEFAVHASHSDRGVVEDILRSAK